MKQSLENDMLLVEIEDKGAELYAWCLGWDGPMTEVSPVPWTRSLISML